MEFFHQIYFAFILINEILGVFGQKSNIYEKTFDDKASELIKELSQLDVLIKNQEERMEKFQKNKDSVVIPQIKDLQKVIEKFYEDYNPTLRYHTMKEFTRGFHRFRKDVEDRQEKIKPTLKEFEQLYKNLLVIPSYIEKKMSEVGAFSLNNIYEEYASMKGNNDKLANLKVTKKKISEIYQKLQDAHKRISKEKREMKEKLDDFTFQVEITGTMIRTLRAYKEMTNDIEPKKKILNEEEQMQIIMGIQMQRSQMMNQIYYKEEEEQKKKSKHDEL